MRRLVQLLILCVVASVAQSPTVHVVTMTYLRRKVVVTPSATKGDRPDIIRVVSGTSGAEFSLTFQNALTDDGPTVHSKNGDS